MVQISFRKFGKMFSYDFANFSAILNFDQINDIRRNTFTTGGSQPRTSGSTVMASVFAIPFSWLRYGFIDSVTLILVKTNKRENTTRGVSLLR